MKKSIHDKASTVIIDVTQSLLSKNRTLSQTVVQEFIARLPAAGEYKSEPADIPLPEFFLTRPDHATHYIEKFIVDQSGPETKFFVHAVVAESDFARALFDGVSKNQLAFEPRAVGCLDGKQFRITNLVSFDIVNKG